MLPAAGAAGDCSAQGHQDVWEVWQKMHHQHFLTPVLVLVIVCLCSGVYACTAMKTTCTHAGVYVLKPLILL